ncbi:MAG TPA: Jag N-terminal domain-containing protein, partial [Firmicutes bacterium]|nr:Jag N-terminal domain-containing protein [Bacillota bacterium]
MLKEVIATGKSVDQAIDSGCQELGIARDEAQFEIIDLPRKAFFGLKVVPAKVRVYVELPDPKPVQEAKPPKSEAPRQPRAPRPPKEKSEKAPRPEKEKTPAAPKAPREEKGEEEPIPVPVPQEELEPMVPTPELEAKAAAAVAYVTEVLHAMGNDSVEVTPKFTHNGVSLVLTGADLGVVIGRRGETLDALQYLSGLVANRLEGDYLRVTIDSGNYREKREKTLGDLAHKLATTAVRTGRSYTLEPMNPYERRI